MKRVIPSPYPEGPLHYWAVMTQMTREAGGFTVRDVHDRCNGPRYSVVKEYLRRCRKMGAITVAGRRDTGRHFPTVIYVVAEGISDAPVVRRPNYQDQRGRGLQQIWRAMRLMTVFSVPDLVSSASTEEIEIKPSLARAYLRALAQAGLIVEVGRRARIGQVATWRLLPAANTGPLAPAMTKSGIVDRNIGRHQAAPLRSDRRAA